eukprot:3984271-Amphidinium_carterae.1
MPSVKFKAGLIVASAAVARTPRMTPSHAWQCLTSTSPDAKLRVKRSPQPFCETKAKDGQYQLFLPELDGQYQQ